MMHEIEIQCPHCWEVNIIEVNEGEGSRQEFVTDCEVCCNPMEIKITINNIDGETVINAVADRANT